MCLYLFNFVTNFLKALRLLTLYTESKKVFAITIKNKLFCT